MVYLKGSYGLLYTYTSVFSYQPVTLIFYCLQTRTNGHGHTLTVAAHVVAQQRVNSWWRHQMETFSVLLALCAGNSPVTGDFPTQKPVTRSFDVFFDLHLEYKRLSKKWWGWWLETPSRSLWRHCNACWQCWVTFHKPKCIPPTPKLSTQRCIQLQW